MNRFLFFFLNVFVVTSALALTPIPELTSPVIDTTDTLSENQIQGLTEQTLKLQQEKGSQIQILIIPSTQPEDIAQYSQRVFDAWKLGREKIDDGVLLVIAKNDRRVRIHVGYGLEPIIPDVTAGHVINEYIVPRFKADDYAEGIIAGTERLKHLIEGGTLPDNNSFRSHSGTQRSNTNWMITILLCGNGLFMVALFSTFYVFRNGKLSDKNNSQQPIEPKLKLSSVLEDAFMGHILLYISLIVATIPMILFAGGISILANSEILFPFLLMFEMCVLFMVLIHMLQTAGVLPTPSAGGSNGGSWSGGDGGGGSGGGGDWSGGGGSSGGGGASGRW